MLQTTVEEQLGRIGFIGDVRVFEIGAKEGVLENFSVAKWEVVDVLNEYYKDSLFEKFDLFNWLIYNDGDEVAYFLCEAGSNALAFGPCCLRVYLGKRGFVIGLEQEESFNALEVIEKNRKENEGAGFAFYRRARSTIFFDDQKNAKIIYFCYHFDDH